MTSIGLLAAILIVLILFVAISDAAGGRPARATLALSFAMIGSVVGIVAIGAGLELALR